ncbi:hypothetical protein ACFQH2_06090 [Natronoarchaeum sp. GCM10025703]
MIFDEFFIFNTRCLTATALFHLVEVLVEYACKRPVLLSSGI